MSEDPPPPFGEGPAAGDAPALSGSDGDLAPALGGNEATGRRAWWRNLKGPIAVLLADLEAQSPRVRRRAVEALARLGDRRAAAALALGLRDKAWEVRLACVHALVKLEADGLVGDPGPRDAGWDVGGAAGGCGGDRRHG